MNTDEILSDLLGRVPDEYDTSVGSFFYDILYPVALQIGYMQDTVDKLADNTFALTATGEYLDRKVAEQGITRNQATYATGTVRIYGTRGTIVLSGAKLAADTILFAVNSTVTIPEAGYVDVTATCVTAGSKGNVGVGQINRFPVTLPGLTSVENITAFTGGYDAESDFDLLERYLAKVQNPNASGNKNNYIEWAKEASAGVGSVEVVPLWNGAGTVKVIITDANNQPAEQELVTLVAQHIEENRPIGASVTVVSAEEQTITISVTIIGDKSDTVQEAIKSAVKEYLSDIALESDYVSYAKIGGLILSVDGVEDYTGLTVNSGTSNVQIDDGHVPVLGSVVIT